MNLIEAKLEPNEKILWKIKTTENLLTPYYLTLLFLIFISIALFIFALIMPLAIISNNMQDSFVQYSIYLIIFLIFLICPLYTIYRKYNQHKIILDSFGIKSHQLRNFEELFILTNKRWIQKSRLFNDFDLFDQFKDLPNYKNGFISLELKNLKIIYAENQEAKKINVRFFKHIKEVNKGTKYYIVLDSENRQEFINAIRKVFEITIKGTNLIHLGDIAYACKLKK